MAPRTLLGPYRQLFTVPGSASFSFAGWLGRFPAPMLGLGSVLLVEAESDSYGLAGAVAGTLALAFAIAGPVWARAMDRRGQGTILRLAMASFLLTGTSFVAVVAAGTPRWTWFLLAAATGFSSPNIGSLVRARWSALLDPQRRQTAFAFEAVADEVVFVLGPPLVTLLATLVAPPVGFLTGLGLGLVGALWLAAQRGTEPPLHGADPSAPQRRRSVLTPTLLVVVVTYLAVGTVFGGLDVVVVGFADEQGAQPFAGLALAVFALGSLVAGLVYGLARLPGTLTTRFVATAVAFGVAAQLLWGVGSLAVLVGAGFLAGLTIAPVLVSGTALVESRAVRGGLTESLAWTITGLTVGVTVGSALAGAAVDAWGAEAAFAVPALAGGLAGLLALACAGLLRAQPNDVPEAADPVGGSTA
ncbi:MFS transporter [Blastococcus sp. CCUG 61487]|uniref:MFS transporter n=1 Tax=Blastococcus sp. CCUG 61487 TaxID=1840703 RepID=UPI0010BFFC3C|nr:MFS transporter [Blastococcus sp. CCUG 61487]TKJ22873.1 MFS transporter [Blastococcus sp. CCUG 61487]